MKDTEKRIHQLIGNELMAKAIDNIVFPETTIYQSSTLDDHHVLLISRQGLGSDYYITHNAYIVACEKINEVNAEYLRLSAEMKKDRIDNYIKHPDHFPLEAGHPGSIAVMRQYSNGHWSIVNFKTDHTH